MGMGQAPKLGGREVGEQNAPRDLALNVKELGWLAVFRGRRGRAQIGHERTPFLGSGQR